MPPSLSLTLFWCRSSTSHTIGRAPCSLIEQEGRAFSFPLTHAQRFLLGRLAKAPVFFLSFFLDISLCICTIMAELRRYRPMLFSINATWWQIKIRLISPRGLRPWHWPTFFFITSPSSVDYASVCIRDKVNYLILKFWLSGNFFLSLLLFSSNVTNRRETAVTHVTWRSICF